MNDEIDVKKAYEQIKRNFKDGIVRGNPNDFGLEEIYKHVIESLEPELKKIVIRRSEQESVMTYALEQIVIYEKSQRNIDKELASLLFSEYLIRKDRGDPHES